MTRKSFLLEELEHMLWRLVFRWREFTEIGDHYFEFGHWHRRYRTRKTLRYPFLHTLTDKIWRCPDCYTWTMGMVFRVVRKWAVEFETLNCMSPVSVMCGMMCIVCMYSSVISMIPNGWSGWIGISSTLYHPRTTTSSNKISSGNVTGTTGEALDVGEKISTTVSARDTSFGFPIIFLEPSFPVLYHIIKRYVFRNIFVRFYRDIVSVSEESEFFGKCFDDREEHRCRIMWCSLRWRSWLLGRCRRKPMTEFLDLFLNHDKFRGRVNHRWKLLLRVGCIRIRDMGWFHRGGWREERGRISSSVAVKVIIWVCLHPSVIDVVKHVCLKSFNSDLKGLDVVVLGNLLIDQVVHYAL